MSRPNQDGYVVLITVLILGAVVSVVAGLLLLTGQNASISSESVASNSGAKAAAIGCAQLALAAISANNSLATPATLNQTVNATTGQTCSYTITGAAPNFTIAATGTVTQGAKTYVHRLSLTTNQVTPQLTVSGWQDVP